MSLLCQLLQVDPLKRATMKNIREHKWFKKDLPLYLFPAPSDQDASIVDIDVVREACEKFSVAEYEVEQAILDGDPMDQLCIAYNFIMDNKHIQDNSIRSQSKPQDIMNEVFRAMKLLNFKWKVINPFHVRTRKVNPITSKHTKINLQLYQVDQKSFLLDFKSLGDYGEKEGLRKTQSGFAEWQQH